MNENNHLSHNKHRNNNRALPDPAICRGRHIKSDLVECLVELPSGCRYALPFGCGFFCLHPERIEIVQRTETKKKKAA